jgi:hypothetical protein
VPGQSAPPIETVAPGDVYVYDQGSGGGGAPAANAASESADEKPSMIPLALIVAVALILGS